MELVWLGWLRLCHTCPTTHTLPSHPTTHTTYPTPPTPTPNMVLRLWRFCLDRTAYCLVWQLAGCCSACLPCCCLLPASSACSWTSLS